MDRQPGIGGELGRLLAEERERMYMPPQVFERVASANPEIQTVYQCPDMPGAYLIFHGVADERTPQTILVTASRWTNGK